MDGTSPSRSAVGRDEWKFTFEHDGRGVIEPEHYATDAEFAVVAAFWELTKRHFPTVAVPPPLVPMVLHGAAENPTADWAALNAAEDPAELATRLVSLMPSVTPWVQHRAVWAMLKYLERTDRHASVAWRTAAQSAGFFSRAAALLKSAWDPSATRWRTRGTTALFLLNTLAFFDEPAGFIESGVMEPIVAHLRTPKVGTGGIEIDCLRVVAKASECSWKVRAHLRALGVIEAIVTHRSLERLHFEALQQVTEHPPGRDAHVPDSLIQILGECLLDTSTEGGRRSRAAAKILCNLIDRRNADPRSEALLAVPGVPEHLYGSDGTLGHPPTRRLAARCAASPGLTARAVAAGLLRPTTATELLAREPNNWDDFDAAARALEFAVRLAPQHAADLMRSGLSQSLARAISAAAAVPPFYGRANVIAAAQCLTAVVRECDASDVVVACVRTSGVVASLNEALVKRHSADTLVFEDLWPPTEHDDLRAVRAAVVAAADALARHDEESFAREADKFAPAVKEALARHRQHSGEDGVTCDTSPSKPSARADGLLERRNSRGRTPSSS